MRKVYHGAAQEITSPLVHVGRDNLDFGKGFYVTGQISEEKALRELSKHQPNNQICILKQEVADKYLKFQKSVITK